MATLYGVGCKDIKAGAIGAAGIMGTTLTSVGKIFKGTVSVVDEDAAVTRHYAEGGRYPFLNVVDQAGTVLKFTLVDIDATNLAKWLGGTAGTGNWESSNENFSQELSVEVDTIFSKTIQIARCMLYGKITWNLSRTEIAKIDITGEVLEPEDADTPPIKTITTVVA